MRDAGQTQPGVQYLFALASYPANPRVLLAEGLLHRKQGKMEEATAAFRQAAQRGVPDARLLLANCI